jgi:hypothetical protein
MDHDTKVIVATAILGTVFALIMYHTGATAKLMSYL